MGEEGDERYDLGNAPDIEKHGYDPHDTSFSSIDSEDDEATSPSTSSINSSRETSGSYQPMLGNSKRKSKSYYLYRLPNRTMRYLCLALMSTIILFILSLVRMSWTSAKQLELGILRTMKPQPAQWESFEFLTRYYGGIRTLVPRDQNLPEYPSEQETAQSPSNESNSARSLPSSTPFHPYPDYTSTTYKLQYGPVRECFLDREEKIKVPDIHSYPGVPQGLPDPVMGSYELFDIQNTNCFERFGRLGPYGFGYSLRKGGIGAGLNGDRDGVETVWNAAPEVDYTQIQWKEAQEKCLSKNNHRFEPSPERHGNTLSDMGAKRDSAEHAGSNKALDRREGTSADYPLLNQTRSGSTQAGLKQISRTAVIIRTWWDYVYTQEDILYLRSLIAELSLQTGGEYTIHFLVHVKDDNVAIWADQDTYDRVLTKALPKEFHGMGTLWTERQMGLLYGGLAESYYRDLPVHGVYRSTFMPLQYFAHRHPEYDYFWNWEMDIRYTGHWYHLFDKVRTWAKQQPRKGLWERNGRFYVPSVHGTWDDFKQMVRVQSEIGSASSNNLWSGLGSAKQTSGGSARSKVDKPIWGPHAPEDVLKLESDPSPTTAYEKDKYTWGVDEEADLITFNPMFDPDGTTWLLAEDFTGYNTTAGPPPRRAAIITASRLSRRLLDTMHREVALQRHTMFSEMWPASCALHHGLKAVYAPHPMYIDRNWPTSYLASVMNSGRNGAAGGARTSVFGDREHNFRGTTWYYNAGFAPNLWRRWLGYRVDNNGGEEAELAGEGRMCLPGILLHPVKGVELVVEGRRDEDAVPDVAEGTVGGKGKRGRVKST